MRSQRATGILVLFLFYSNEFGSVGPAVCESRELSVCRNCIGAKLELLWQQQSTVLEAEQLGRARIWQTSFLRCCGLASGGPALVLDRCSLQAG